MGILGETREFTNNLTGHMKAKKAGHVKEHFQLLMKSVVIAKNVQKQ